MIRKCDYFNAALACLDDRAEVATCGSAPGAAAESAVGRILQYSPEDCQAFCFEVFKSYVVDFRELQVLVYRLLLRLDLGVTTRLQIGPTGDLKSKLCR